MAIDICKAKFPHWLTQAKEIIAADPDVVVCFNNTELINYINFKMPIQFKLTYSYIIQLLYHDPSTTSKIGFDMEQVAIQFRDWWDHIHSVEQLSLYKKMMQNDRCHIRELGILERRFKSNWQKEDKIDLKADSTVKGQININFKQV